MMKKILKRTTVVILILVVVFMVANVVSVKPYIAIFRTLTGLRSEEVMLGSYEDKIEGIQESDLISIPVASYPDATLTLSGDATNELQPLIVLIHGGGWSGGSAAGISSYAKLLAASGYRVANIDYALAPEYPYPASTMELVEVMNYLYENADRLRLDTSKIFIGGNSAGAHLSSQLGLLLTNEDYAQKMNAKIVVPKDSIKGLFLFNGVFNFDTVGDAGFPGFDKYAWSYTGVKNWKTYDRLDEMSTIKHVTKDFPPSFLTAGDIDPLESQTLEMIKELESKDIQMSTVLWTGEDRGLNHDYMYDLESEESLTVYETLVEFLKKYTIK